jgi:hypothetical protein
VAAIGERVVRGIHGVDAPLEERRGGGKNERWETVFRGVIIQMAFGRPFRSTTLLQRAGEHRLQRHRLLRHPVNH